MQNLIDIRGVSFAYGKDRAILRDISFSVHAGEAVALLGENGGGKSTLLNIITGFIKPQCGTIRVANRNAASLTLRERARLISYIPQRLPAIPDFYKVKDFVIEGRHAYRPFRPWQFGRYKAEDYDKADEVLKQCNLSQYASSSVKDLSGGEVQNMVFAQSMMKDAPICIFDEPLANLDIRHQKDFFALVKSFTSNAPLSCLQQVSARCVLFSIHDIDLAVNNATRILLLDHGTISFDGKPSEITCEVLGKAYRTQISDFPQDGKRYFYY